MEPSPSSLARRAQGSRGLACLRLFLQLTSVQKKIPKMRQEGERKRKQEK